ncbi:RHS repeat-associated core domain-containing protein [Gynuella sunshinyii]|uniref:Rhs family protein n=1 Tax=Gynuella sunshinyii YC6258 TaxID=1445510 RepID=A0A0C5VKG7_9GAMM|nr:RHS repeat-associated core domain-containing protein [Gynuella sunshinyii]AJQ94746.1 rhs family protein [Gynuella sunshinyii YC6258]
MGDRHFSYDEYGNLVQIKKGKDQKIVQSLEYNAKHQLIKFEERINGTLKQALTFRYDPFGRRIEKSVFKQDKPEQQTEWATNYKRYRTHNQPDLWYQYAERYVWNGGNLIQTRHIDCNLNNRTFQQYYLYEPYSHKPVGLYDYELGLLDIEADHLGTAKALYSHETGEQLWATEHEVYGKTKNSQSHKTHPKNGFAVDPKLRFAGQYEDIETGLYQNFNRYYDPRTGRYISHDPIGLAGGLNVYQYCPNPVEWVDPLGLSCKEIVSVAEGATPYEAFGNARQMAREKAGLEDDAIPFVQEIGPHKGRVTGMQSPDGTRGWRIDFDPSSDKGFHINWWVKNGLKRKDWTLGAVKVDGASKSDYLSILEHFPHT